MKKTKGMTLVEVIIYIAIVGTITTALMTMTINIMSLKGKSMAMQEVNDSLRFMAEKIDYEIKNAKSLANTTSDSITINTIDPARNQTVFSLVSGNLQMSVGATAANLNSNLVNISNFTVTNLSSGDSKTANINYTITANYINPGNRSEFNYSSFLEGSVEVRSK